MDSKAACAHILQEKLELIGDLVSGPGRSFMEFTSFVSPKSNVSHNKDAEITKANS